MKGSHEGGRLLQHRSNGRSYKKFELAHRILPVCENDSERLSSLDYRSSVARSVRFGTRVFKYRISHFSDNGSGASRPPLNNIEEIPKPDGLVESFYRAVALPAMVGAFMIPGSDLFARLWFMPWYWFHASNATPSCRYILIGAFWSLLSMPITAVVTAILTRQRAAFATMVGLAVYIPLHFLEIKP
jgi:hypothetical protein